MGLNDLLDALVPGAGSGQLDPDAPPFPTGLGLELVDLIARGGTGWIYRARDPLLDREVAVKVSRPDGGAAARQAVLEEARATARLAHPAVLPVHRIAAENGLICVVWRLAPGTTLARRLHEARNRPPEDWPLARRLAQLRIVIDAVTRAHALELLHGDLHPGNVALAHAGEPYVLDWGGASGPEGTFSGDPAYAAPERLFGEPPSPAADVFSLGAVAWELCTLRRLRNHQPDQSVGEHVQRWRSEPAPRAASVAPVDVALDTLIAQALHPDPTQRPTATELRDQLDGILTGQAEASRRQAHATVALDESRHALEAFRQAERRVAEERQVAAVLRARVPGHAPVEQKRPAWEASERVERLLQEEADEWTTAAERATLAAALLPESTEAQEVQAEVWWARFQQAERNGDAVEAALCRSRVERYDTGRYGRVLASPGQLTLSTDAPGATATIARFETRDLRRIPEPVGTLALPLERHPLPAGSYAITLTAPGRAPTVYPVVIRRMEQYKATARLFTEAQVGEGWCFVPGGPFQMGGDSGARQPLDRCTPFVDDRFVQRTAVTSGAWLQFLDDLPVGQARLHVPGEVGLFGGDRGFFQHDGTRWQLPTGWDPQWPVTAIDLSDAEAYATWLSAREGRTVRLPTEEEWEKAARGVDGRVFPWGDGFDPTFAHMRQSRPGAPTPWKVADYPVDCSVYGVRDMAGGMREWTSSMFDEGQMVLRGGTWGDDADDLRCACRSGVRPTFRYSFVSFRLVSEQPRPG